MDVSGKQFVLEAMAQGLLMNWTHEAVLRFLPPYTVSEREIDQAVSKLAKVSKRHRLRTNWAGTVYRTGGADARSVCATGSSQNSVGVSSCCC